MSGHSTGIWWQSARLEARRDSAVLAALLRAAGAQMVRDKAGFVRISKLSATGQPDGILNAAVARAVVVPSRTEGADFITDYQI